MRKILLLSLLAIIVFNGCKKDGGTKTVNTQNADIAGTFLLSTYTRNDSKEYTATELPCLSTNFFIIKTDGTTSSYSTGTSACYLTPPPTGLNALQIGGNSTPTFATYLRNGNNIIITLKTSTVTRKSYADFTTISGKLNLTIRDTINDTFSGVPLYMKAVYVRQ